ncbi:Nonsense-mediated mRNA decay protein 2 [Listeria monocytogenes N53-1]|nr:Nonsense-mediated mRNA decay protein 2 [Listeria monocytogenes N53-1]
MEQIYKLARIQAKITALKEKDGDLNLFGSENHAYKLNQPLSNQTGYKEGMSDEDYDAWQELCLIKKYLDFCVSLTFLWRNLGG